MQGVKGQSRCSDERGEHWAELQTYFQLPSEAADGINTRLRRGEESIEGGESYQRVQEDYHGPEPERNSNFVEEEESIPQNLDAVPIIESKFARAGSKISKEEQQDLRSSKSC